MANKKLTVRVEITVTNEDRASSTPPTHVIEKEATGLTNVQADNMRSVANGATVILWDANDFGIPPSFSYFILWSDREVQVEFTAGEGEANEELCVHYVPADYPLLLGPDDTFRGHGASDALGGTADVFDKIRVKNASGATAKIQWIFVE